MDDRTWTIVQFAEDFTVEAIPTSWIQGDFCHWPPYKQERLSTAIKKSEALNTNWPRHAVKIFRNATFDDYTKARQKAKVAEDYSDLNSDGEFKGKRKRIQKILSSSSDESLDKIESINLPSPPKLPKLSLKPKPKPSTSSHPTSYVSDCKGSSFNINESISEETFMENILPRSSEMEHQTVFKTKQFPATKLDANVNSINDILSRSSETEHQTVFKTKQFPATKLDANVNSMKEWSKGDNANRGTCCLQHENNILVEIKNQNHLIRGILVDVLKEIRELKNNKSEIMMSTSIFVKYADIIKFPIENDEDLTKFEEQLRNEDNFIEAVNELAKFGGSNPYNFIKRSMSSILKDSVLTNYSWLGRKGKKSLETSTVAKALVQSAMKCLNCNKKEVELAIQSFVKRSSERMKFKENKKVGL